MFQAPRERIQLLIARETALHSGNDLAGTIDLAAVADSHLIERLRDGEMPPERRGRSQRLPDAEIAGTEIHKMRRGDSLWVLTHRKFNVPLWLLRQYNPDLDFEAVPLNLVIKQMQRSARINLVFLDACRDNITPAYTFINDGTFVNCVNA